MTNPIAVERPTGTPRSTDRPGSSLRVAFVSFTDPSDADRMAGMPHTMARELSRRVARLETFSPEGGTGMPPRPAKAPPGRVARKLGRLKRRFVTFDGSIKHLEHLYPEAVYRRTIRRASAVSTSLVPHVLRGGFDVVLGCTVTWPLVELAGRMPVVFFTDGTPAMMNRSWDMNRRRSEGFRRACVDIESGVYARASAVAFAAEEIYRSAIDDHGLDPSRGEVVPMGANVVPEVPLASVEHLDAPGPEGLRLTLVASDPVRKRTDFAVEVVEELARQGIRTSLTVVGRPTERALASPHVRCLGLLKLSDPADRRKHQQALAEGHILILPSTAEGAPISPAEAAHHGRPSVVSAADGLPTVVQDGVTGRVMPMSCTPGDYARAIAEIVRDPATYRRMSAQALDRAHGRFSWDAWSTRMASLMEDAVRSWPGSSPAAP